MPSLVCVGAAREVTGASTRTIGMLALRLGRPWPSAWHVVLHAVATADDAR